MNNQWDEIKDLDDIPGTTVFTGHMARLGFHLNQFCMSLMHQDSRQQFKADEKAYLAQWPISAKQRDAVLRRDYSALIQLGGNIYFLAKIGATDGLPFICVAASMSGLTEEEYRAMMNQGGRSAVGLRSIREGR